MVWWVIENDFEEEQKHLKFFEERLYEAREKEDDYFEDDGLLNYMDFGVFSPYNSIGEVENILSDINKVLRLGIVIEEKSIKFYALCRDNVLSDETKRELGYILEEEHKHKELLGKIVGRS